MPRDNSLHLLDYFALSGKYWTHCGKCFTKQDQINVLAIDDTVPGICNECRLMGDYIYSFNLEVNPMYARNKSKDKQDRFLINNKKNYIGPKAKYLSLKNRLPVNKKYSILITRQKKYV